MSSLLNSSTAVSAATVAAAAGQFKDKLNLKIKLKNQIKQERRRNDERKLLVLAIGACFLLLSFVHILDINLTEYITDASNNNSNSNHGHNIHENQDHDQEYMAPTIERSLSINLGDGNCQWTKPEDAPQDDHTELFSTLLAAYPGSGKRTAFMQLEGMTELRAGDDYNLNPDSVGRKFAFMKSSYPQHEGIWSFGDKMDQVILLIRNPRWALPSYQHLLHEIQYSVNWEHSYARRDYVYTMRPPLDDWLTWREIRFDTEIQKWGWFIDYWMEGGLCRDIFSNDLTSGEHFERLIQPIMYAQAELIAAQASLYSSSTTSSGTASSSLQPYIDGHCKNDMVGGCKPVAIASFERIIDPETGPQEVDRFVAAIEGKVGLNVIEEEARECVWRELIINGKGNTNTYRDRDGNGPDEHMYTFTVEQMYVIQDEIGRLRMKYSSGVWVDDVIAQSLVEYLDEYTAENEEEIRHMT